MAERKLCTIEHKGSEYVVFVRKATPLEVFRLMGLTDKEANIIIHSGIPKTACYKLAGNSIVVDTLYKIFDKLFIHPGSEEAQLSIFGNENTEKPRFTKDNPLRVATLCAGYDSQCLALERIKAENPDFDYELVAWSEFDPASKKPIDKQPAVIAHNALFPQWKDRNYGDMTKIDWSTFPKCDLLFYSTPCQSISQAGLQHGFEEGSGTRSSIIWNVRDAVKAINPKYAILENVDAMVSAKFLPFFNLWRDELQKLGYDNYAKLLNAKEYGVPQNRKRIFLISLREDISNGYNFPAKCKPRKELVDMLETTTETQYFLPPPQVDKFIQANLDKIRQYIDETEGEIEELPIELEEWLSKYESGEIQETEIEPIEQEDEQEYQEEFEDTLFAL